MSPEHAGVSKRTSRLTEHENKFVESGSTQKPNQWDKMSERQKKIYSTIRRKYRARLWAFVIAQYCFFFCTKNKTKKINSLNTKAGSYEATLSVHESYVIICILIRCIWWGKMLSIFSTVSPQPTDYYQSMTIAPHTKNRAPTSFMYEQKTKNNDSFTWSAISLCVCVCAKIWTNLIDLFRWFWELQCNESHHSDLFVCLFFFCCFAVLSFGMQSVNSMEILVKMPFIVSIQSSCQKVAKFKPKPIVSDA